MPRGAEREALVNRLHELEDSIQPTPGPAMNKAILKLIVASPTYGMTDKDSAVLVGLYAEALAEMPVWTVEEARRRFGQHKHKCVWNGEGRPQSGHVYAECRQILLPIEQEIGDLRLILDAVVVDTNTTEDDRKAALAHWETIKREIVSSAKGETPKNLQAAGLRETNDREKLKEHARLAAAGVEVPVSPDGLTISTALRESNQRYAAERGIRQPQEA